MADVIGNTYSQPQYGEGAQPFGGLAAFLQGQQDSYNQSARQYQDQLAQKQAETEMALKQQQAQSYAAQVDAQTRETNARIPGLEAQGLLSQQQAAAPAISSVADSGEATAQANWARISPTLPDSVRETLSNPDGSLNTAMLKQYAGNQNLSPSATKIATNQATNQRAENVADKRYQQGVDTANIKGQWGQAIANTNGGYKLQAAQIAANASRDYHSAMISLKQGQTNPGQLFAGAEIKINQLQQQLDSDPNMDATTKAQLQQAMGQYRAIQGNMFQYVSARNSGTTNTSTDLNNFSQTTAKQGAQFNPTPTPQPAVQPRPVAAPQPQAQTTTQPPQNHIDYLKAHNDPQHVAAFEAKYGRGSAAKYLGGK